MAKISTYPVVAPQGSDIIIGTDANDSNATKNFTVSSVLGLYEAPVAGWQRFDDDEFTSMNKLELLDGVVQTLPNNGITSYSYGPHVFYDPSTSKVLSINENDTYSITVVFKAEAPNANQTHLDFFLTSGGLTPYERLSDSMVFAKGNSTEQNFHLVYQYYADADAVNDGISVKINSHGGTAYVWDIVYFIQRNQIAV